MPHRSPPISQSELLKALKAAADPTRLRILRMLAVKPLCVCEVMSVLGMAQSTTSRHLRLLHDAGLIEEEPGGVWTVYALAAVDASSMIGTLLQVIRGAEPTGQSKTDEERACRVDRARLCRKDPERKIRSRR